MILRIPMPISLAMISILAFFTACSGGEKHGTSGRIEIGMLDEQRAYREVELLLEIGNRDSGTPGARAAARHIAERLEAIGIHAQIESFADETPRGEMIFHNVVANIPGASPELVVIGSHFDTKSGMPSEFQGANDSGSSTGLLIEIGRVLRASPPLGFGIQLVFFDGEECMQRYSPIDGLHGSRHHLELLLAEEREIEAVIILDMVGDRGLDIAFPRNNSSELVAMAFDIAREQRVRKHFGIAESSVIDDHLPFHQAGIPAINFIDFNFGSRPGLNDYWHTVEDRIDKICPESLGIVGRVTLAMLERLDRE